MTHIESIRYDYVNAEYPLAKESMPVKVAAYFQYHFMDGLFHFMYGRYQSGNCNAVGYVWWTKMALQLSQRMFFFNSFYINAICSFLKVDLFPVDISNLLRITVVVIFSAFREYSQTNIIIIFWCFVKRRLCEKITAWALNMYYSKGIFWTIKYR